MTLRGEFVGYAFIPLLEEPEASQSLQLLTSRLAPQPSVPASCVQPPIGGLDFISTVGEVADALDTWWGHTVPPDRLPVLIALHEPGLERWIEHVDAEAVVGVPSERELRLYAGLANVQAIVSRDVRVLSELVTQAYPDCFEVDWPTEPESIAPAPFRPAAAHEAPSVAYVPPPVLAAPPPAGPRQADLAPLDGEPISALPGPPPPKSAVAPSPAPREGGGAVRRSLLDRAAGILGAGPRARWLPDELAQLATSHSLGRIVGVTSRAGGVGKTAIAAALGIVYGEAVEGSGWTAAVVDQNIGNPDQWGRLALDVHVPTVFQIMADIENGSQWSVPAWNRTPALAVYPERRDIADGYSPGQVERFAAQLRQLHALSVIDLPNRIPSFASSEAALCAAWVGVADLLLVPTTDDPTRLQGVLDYLDAPMVRGDDEAAERSVSVIVPYQRSPLRAVREDAGVREMLAQIRSRVAAVVEIPKNERATLAVVRGQPITEVDPGLRSAFVELALTVARVLAGG